jgi:hypothetical protein
MRVWADSHVRDLETVEALSELPAGKQHQASPPRPPIPSADWL